ncbi:uncharacterized protein LOC127638175 [Xyrauchen texanus]|uniref:uncharacterized protein LOC127638175 n=1 Tax=Xyrauchen texanus TaxID=154827 RepID=UPI0022421A78|nr:uncharacterized protein LOC127638175 [Xyrauchen texanus]
MTLTRTKPNWIFTLILTFHITSVQLEGFHKSDLRVLIVGGKSSAQLSVVNTLLGRKDSRQEDRQIIKYVIIENEGREMMLVTAPNLCEKNPASRDFKTALTLSSPGPHAVLITLNLDDLQSEGCDLLQQVQEQLGAQVLRHCIVVLLGKNDPNSIPVPWRMRVGELINDCGGRFLVINDSDPRSAQRAALVEKIDKLVWITGAGFHFTPTKSVQKLMSERLELLKRLQYIESILKQGMINPDGNEDPMSVIYRTLGTGAGILSWILLKAVIVYTEGRHTDLKWLARFVALVLVMVTLRHVLRPDFVYPLNLVLCSTLANVLTKILPQYMNIDRRLSIKDILIHQMDYHVLFCVCAFMGCIVGLFVGTIMHVMTESNMLLSTPGVTLGDLVFWGLSFKFHKFRDEITIKVVLVSFLCSMLVTEISMGCVFFVFGVKIVIVLLIGTFTCERFSLRKERWMLLIFSILILLTFSYTCVFVNSTICISDMMMTSFTAFWENVLSALVFFAALRTCCFCV